ncbi:MAG: TerC family protein [Pseudomonadales bacterium]
MEALLTPEAAVAFLTLTALEIVLGIDNIVFISVLTQRLPEHQRARARFLGLAAAMVTRILLLFSLAWIMNLTEPLFALMQFEISGRDLILLFGGTFLIAKATREVHNSLEGELYEATGTKAASFGGVLAQIALVDVVFSLDSVITAVGLVEQIPIMVAAIVVSVCVMMLSAGSINRFIEAHPTVKMLALTFLVLIGTALVAEGLDFHVPKGYIYFAMAFSIAVEMLNIKMQSKKRKVVQLRQAQLGDLIQ